MNPFIDAKKSEVTAAIEHFKQELSHIRTGQANPELLDGIMVEVYDSRMPINQLSSISVPEPKQLLITPWDKAVSKEIEKAIVQASLGFTPVNEGDVIRVPMPAMTEENRKELVKLVKKRAEQSRVSLRQIRDRIKETIIEAEKEKELTEDDKFKYLKQLDDYTSDKSDEITKMAEEKEEKIMKV